MATTMLELIERLSRVCSDERQVARLAARLLRTGRIRLTGSFRDASW